MPTAKDPKTVKQVTKHFTVEIDYTRDELGPKVVVKVNGRRRKPSPTGVGPTWTLVNDRRHSVSLDIELVEY
jgi:hypothetical protein